VPIEPVKLSPRKGKGNTKEKEKRRMARRTFPAGKKENKQSEIHVINHRRNNLLAHRTVLRVALPLEYREKHREVRGGVKLVLGR